MVDIQAKLKEIGPFVEGADDNLLVCRCEEVTKGQIRKAVHEGIFTLEEMRRYLRSGMGLCQGQTCGKLVKGIIASELKSISGGSRSGKFAGSNETNRDVHTCRRRR